MSDEHAKAQPDGAAPTSAAAGALLDHDGATLVAPSGLVAGTSLAPATSSAPSLAPSPHELVAGRYEIQGLIGSGGMGTVYRARDRELDELVALKVLRHELASTPEMLERFRREVKLARRVTHRNVARVFDIGEHAGEKFLTMELVEGDSLGALLEREGRLPLGRAVEIARGICAGLASAHAAGVVHRDLKPDNVLLARDGRVVVSDFGIARALVVGSSAETMGSVVGTPAYMAPEQVEGRHDVDHRADIYAFGALFYEMLVGERAWPGDAPFAVAAARLVADPPDPRAVRAELPAACAELVLCCLERRPEDRVASIAEVEAGLAAVVLPTLVGVGEPRGPGATGAPGTAGATLAAGPRARQPDKTVAVLPFRNTGGPEDAYLADELTDDLIDNLSMTPGLRVSARGAVARYRNADGDPREIGRDLGVRVVVEGSVRRTRGGLRVTARLVSVADGFQLWAKRFDRPAEDALAVNDEAAAAIAAALTVEHQKSERDAPSDPRAVELYLRARHEYRKFWPEHQRRAIEHFDQALALAPR
ncbi:MAG: protein kinase, partial [Myxococcales bacterium]|nr:protein kinase [Myxococcales bacterium]